jgi:hypothetical protein
MKDDINDTLRNEGEEAVRARHDRARKYQKKKPNGKDEEPSEGVTLADFSAYMPSHSYIYKPSREMWPGSSVNSRIGLVALCDERGNPVLDDNGKQKFVTASAWLDQNSAVEQMTWAPGQPMLIDGRLISDGGWIERQGVTCFNLYRPPKIELGNAAEAER